MKNVAGREKGGGEEQHLCATIDSVHTHHSIHVHKRDILALIAA